MKRTVFIASMVALTLSVVGCDGATKRLAATHLKGEKPVSLISGVLDLTYAENRGIGFNMERVLPEKARRPFAVLSSVLLTPLILLLWLRSRESPWFEHPAWALLLAGALGNLVDRVFVGHVVDFIQLPWWPVFNVADIALVVGALWLVGAQTLVAQRAR